MHLVYLLYFLHQSLLVIYTFLSQKYTGKSINKPSKESLNAKPVTLAELGVISDEVVSDGEGGSILARMYGAELTIKEAKDKAEGITKV